MDQKIKDRIDALLKGKLDDIKVIEFGIDFQVVQKYMKLMASKTEKLSPQLLEEKINEFSYLDIDEQKEVLIHLARSGSIASYRALEAFMENEESEEMQKWTIIALQHCRMRLENELLDEPIKFIATGLGGKGLKLRYYYVLESKETLRKVILDEVIYQYQNIAKSYDAEIESIEQFEDFILVKILCPIKVQLSELIEEGLENLPFLVDNFVATNVMRPTLEKMKERMSKKNDADENPILN